MSKWHFVIASGPSLRREDCDALRGLGTAVAVNTSVFYAPWAEYLFAADAGWWNYYGPKIDDWYRGQRVSSTHKGPRIKKWNHKGWSRNGGNSGHQAIQYSVDELGAVNIGIIGFDHKHTGGKSHFHGDHPRNEHIRLANAAGVHHWTNAMNRTAKDLKRRNVRMVNLSRETALTCFELMSLEDFLSIEFPEVVELRA